MSIGYEDDGGKMVIIFKKNSISYLCSEKTKDYDEVSEYSKIYTLCIYEGENEIAKENIKIGEYHFNLKSKVI